MSQNFKDFLKLRDSLYEAMTKASAEIIRSADELDSLDSKETAVAALLAAHISCCHTIIQCVDSSQRDIWTKILVDGLHNALVKNNSKQDRSVNTLH